MNYYNYDKDLVPVSRDFIADALYDRFEAVKDRRASQIHIEKIDDFVEMVCECGGNLHSASYMVDNRLINSEHGTYEDCWKYSLNEEGEREGSDEQIEAVEKYLFDNGYLYDRDLEEYCSY